VFGRVIWACSLLGVSCGPATDSTMSTIQAAYQLESQSSGSRHDSGLKKPNATATPALVARFNQFARIKIL
jgi:hypothetical protein